MHSSKKPPATTPLFWVFFEYFEFEILVCVIASLVWYTFTSLVSHATLVHAG